MPQQTSWIIENHLVQMKYTGDISVEDLVEGSTQLKANLESSDAPLVHVLVDVLEMTSFPKRVQEITPIVREAMSHPRYGWLVLVGFKNPFVSSLAFLVSQIFRSRYRAFKTYDEAMHFLEQVDPELMHLA